MAYIPATYTERERQLIEEAKKAAAAKAAAKAPGGSEAAVVVGDTLYGSNSPAVTAGVVSNTQTPAANTAAIANSKVEENLYAPKAQTVATPGIRGTAVAYGNNTAAAVEEAAADKTIGDMQKDNMATRGQKLAADYLAKLDQTRKTAGSYLDRKEQEDEQIALAKVDEQTEKSAASAARMNRQNLRQELSNGGLVDPQKAKAVLKEAGRKDLTSGESVDDRRGRYITRRLGYNPFRPRQWQTKANG